MNSFFFWLTVAAGIGAILSQLMHPGALEIIIVVAILNFAFYSYRRLLRTTRRTTIE